VFGDGTFGRSSKVSSDSCAVDVSHAAGRAFIVLQAETPKRAETKSAFREGR
jgi:hypothetical protein